MSDLTTFRDHARRMSTAERGDACEAVWHTNGILGGLVVDRREKPDPHCPGCVTDDERALWARLADEVEAYMAPGPGLWGDDDA